jgi:hypothetical protein
MESVHKEEPATGVNTLDKIVEAYIDYMLMHGEEPASVYSFCKTLDINESEFYEFFNDFGQIAERFWRLQFEETLETLEKDAAYAEFSVREKMLSLYYAFFEQMKKHRSFAVLSFKESIASLKREHKHLGEMKRSYKQWVKQLVAEGLSQGEIAGRSKLTDTYDELYWIQFLFLLNFWKNDRSKNFERTDAAVEKTVNLSFDLIEKNALDSALDFGKFIFQNR